MPQGESTQLDQADIEARVLDIVYGHWRSQILRALATLSVADHLADGPLTAAEVAAREGSLPDRTYRLMRAGVAIGMLRSTGQGLFESTPLLEAMQSGAPRSLHPIIMGFTAPWHTLSMRLLADAIRTGIQPATTALGTDLFTFLEENPEQGREFSDLMAALTVHWAGDVADRLDTTDVRCAIDVGGATGSLLRQLQGRNPQLRGVIFDRPNVAEKVAQSIAASGQAQRLDAVGGDFFVAVPPGDLYLLKMILHDWDDEHCVTILDRCREAMEPGGRVVIVEWIMGDPDDPGFAALMDLNMLTSCQDGRERTLDEFDALLQGAGLRRSAIHRNPLGHSVIEAHAK